jgi:RecA/RadA recombinase
MRSNGGAPPPDATRPLVVEFIGVPGSGKTTLSVELVALLRARHFRAATTVGAAREHARRTRCGRWAGHLRRPRLERALLWQLFYACGLVHAGAFVRERPLLARHVVRSQLRRRLPIASRVHVLRWFFQLAGRYRFLTSSAQPREVLVFDDGFLHRSIHLYATAVGEPDSREVAGYVDLLPAPDVVVFAVADQETCEARVHQRGVWPHSQRVPHGALSAYLANAEYVADIAVRRARQRGWKVVAINNADRTLDRVRHDLERALDCPPFRSPSAISPLRGARN